MKNIIFMGKTGSGKTTLCQKLDQLELKYKKTQSIEVYNNAIDTPGEYMENRMLYHALITTSADAKIIALVYDPIQEENYIAPGFASIFCNSRLADNSLVDVMSMNKSKDYLVYDGLKNMFNDEKLVELSKTNGINNIDTNNVLSLKREERRKRRNDLF